MILGQAPQQIAMAGPSTAQAGMMQAVQPGALKVPSAMTPPQPSMQAPQTGLIGSEQALLGGQTAAMGSMAAGNTAAAGYLNQAANNQVTAPQMLGAQMAAPEGLTTAYSQGVNTGIGSGQFNQAVGGLDPYADQGGGAAKLQADLTGANGQQAQQAAYAQYQSSPAMQYQMDQMQKATERSAAARGGLLGGNVLMELQRNASGIASQDYQNQFNNMTQVTNTGLNAAAQQGNILGQQGAMLGSLEGQRMGNEANIYGQQLAGQTQLAGQKYQNESQQNIAKYQGELQASQTNAQLKSDAYTQLASLAQANGLNTAGLLTGTAQQLSQGRTQAGQDMAQNATQAASQIADKLAQSGLAVSDTMARDISTMTDMIYQSGMQDKIDSQQLATILANISGGQASTVAQGYSNIGSANAAGTLGVANAVQGGITQAIGSGLIG